MNICQVCGAFKASGPCEACEERAQEALERADVEAHRGVA